MTPFDPGLLPLATLLLILLAALTVPLAAAVFFALAFLLFLNPQPLPDGFLSSYSLAMRLNSQALISTPLFALAGELAVAAGITERLLRLVDALLCAGNHAIGKRAVAGCALYATVSGVGQAAVRECGKQLVPAMLKAGYKNSTAAALLACAAATSIVIPASIPLTIYAATVGMQTNIVFTASFVPGVFLALLLYAAVAVHDRRNKYAAATATETFSTGKLRALKNARWSIALPLLVLSFLFTGFLTAPEAAAFASAYAALVGLFVHKQLDAPQIRAAAVRAAVTASAVLLMAGIGGLAAGLLESAGVIDELCRAVYSFAGGRVGSILFINIILLLAGCVLDMPAIITLIAPLFIPLAAMCGMGLPQFGVMVVFNLAIGLVTPPQAYNLQTAADMTRAGMWQTARASIPFFAAMIICLGLVSYWPALSLWFPRFFGWAI